jgi:predicted signal transduction protein with EAL and GGDEF domain
LVSLRSEVVATGFGQSPSDSPDSALRAGCSRFQGYFFGKPAPRDRASALCVAAREPLALTA